MKPVHVFLSVVKIVFTHLSEPPPLYCAAHIQYMPRKGSGRGKEGEKLPAKSISPRTDRWLYGTMLVLFIAVWVAFSPALDNDFVSWDDPTYVLENPTVLHPNDAHSADLWRTPVSLNYHPLTMMTLVWNSRSADRPRPSDPPNAHPFILTNIWLHALNTLLVLLFIHRLTRGNLPVAAFCAVVFALHPMHVESVVWVSERKDVLYTFFFMAGLVTWLKWSREGKPIWYAATVLLFTASCLSKAMAVVFPLVLVLVDVWERRPLQAWRPWSEKAPLFAISLFFGLMAMNVQSGGDFHGLLHVDRALGTTVAVAEKLPYTALDQLRYGAYGYVMYLVRFVFPAGLGTFHPYPEGDARGLLFWTGPFIVVAVVAFAIWSLRKGRAVFFGIGFFTVCVALVLQFLPVGRAVMAERYTYMPYIGLAFLAAFGMDHLLREHPSRGRIWAGITAGVALVFIPLTRAQTDVWQNTRTLFRQVIRNYPGDADAYAILGSWYGKRSGQEHAPALLDSAGMVLMEGARAGASSGPLFEALATYHGSQGRTDSALVWFDRAVAKGPVTGQLMHNRAMARYTSDPKGCMEDLERAIQLGHGRVGESYALRARARYRDGQYAGALEDIATAMDRFGHRRADAYLLRGLCQYRLGQKEQAASNAREVLKLEPNSAQAQELLSAALK
jgi:tetratricopeptide (TPR) repeat protein